MSRGLRLGKTDGILKQQRLLEYASFVVQSKADRLDKKFVPADIFTLYSLNEECKAYAACLSRKLCCKIAVLAMKR